MWISGTDGVEDADPFTRFVGDAPSRTRSERELLTLWYTVQRRPSAAALKAYGRLVSEYLPWVERRLVIRARTEGMSWSAIGRLLGRSRQAVQKRHDRPMTPNLLTAPARPDRLGERERREREVDSADRRRRQFADDASADGDLVAW